MASNSIEAVAELKVLLSLARALMLPRLTYGGSQCWQCKRKGQHMADCRCGTWLRDVATVFEETTDGILDTPAVPKATP